MVELCVIIHVMHLQALYPLQSINGNRMKLLGALRELKTLCSSTLPASSRSMCMLRLWNLTFCSGNLAAGY